MKGLSFVVAITLVLGVASQAVSMEKDLTKSHAYIVTAQPGGGDVSAAYSGVVNLHRLNKKEHAYWNPHSSKYIVDGDDVYLWTVIYKEGKSPKEKHRWVAVEKGAFDRALSLQNQFASGIAFYQLTYNGKDIIMKAYPYSTMHAILGGQKVVDVKE